ncbi:hypothetical protein FGO68_gene7134 [Halteria grandinella]|uniref:Uncharacterized protein n=1 Tax=Halteria grandinella TaxID=5974 RepID=A0A8J8SZZ3_HALGN|nr:hypothetical protein FGO68_gene7134 [Halteria grandinella]
MLFNRRHQVYIMGVLIIYAIENIVASSLRGKPIYNILRPDSWVSYLILLGLLVACFLIHLSLEVLVNKRNNRWYNKQQNQIKCASEMT